MMTISQFIYLWIISYIFFFLTIGSSWAVLESPGPTSPLSHVNVGDNSVWALSRDRRVWFRNGIRAASSGDNESLAKGTKWTEMVGEMVMLSVGPGDQILGITEADRSVVFRTGVSLSDLSGKTWRPVTAPTVRMRTQSCATSIASSTVSTPRQARRIVAGSASSYSSQASLQSGTSNSQFKMKAEGVNIPSEVRFLRINTCYLSIIVSSFQTASTNSTSSSSSPPTVSEMDAGKRRAVPRNSESPVVDKSMYVSAVDSIDKLSFKEESVFGDTASNNIIVDHEDIYMDDLSNGPGGECGPQWVWLTVGSCRIDQLSGPPSGWFLESAASHQSLSGEPWRVAILQKLRDNNEATSNNPAFKCYQSAIERTSWVKKLSAKFHPGEPRAR